MIRAAAPLAAVFVAALALTAMGAAQPLRQAQLSTITWYEPPRGPPDFADLYPARALERCRNGEVDLTCHVRADGRIDCLVTRERPRGWGFGDASLRAARRFRVAPAVENGWPTDNGSFDVGFYWETDRNFSERVNSCQPTIDGPRAECVVRVSCPRE